jgi:hypothetical protein
MQSTADQGMLQEFVGQVVVLDLRDLYVCLGKLQSVDEHFMEMKNADFHDLRDTETTRENYIAAARMTGIKRNRKRVLIRRSEVVALSLLEDIVEN